MNTGVVCKFGGSSLANQKAIQHVIDNIITKKKKICPKLKSCIICVSAPGKRHKDDIKVTDSLIELHKLALTKNRKRFDKMFFTNIHSRYIEISKQNNIIQALEHTAGKIYDNAISNNNSNNIDFALSRGEYLNAIAICNLLNIDGGNTYEFIDAGEIIRFNDDCTLNYNETINTIKSTISTSTIIPGFYGTKSSSKNDTNNTTSLSQQNIVTFSRGGSDVTGALVAAALSDEYDMVYENWTDVDGIFNVDPNLCQDATVWNKLTYDHVHALSLAGANVFHPDAIYPVEINNVKTNIRNTNKPVTSNGTWIVNDLQEDVSINNDSEDQIAIGVSSIFDYNEIRVVSSNVNNNDTIRNIMIETIENLNIKYDDVESVYEAVPHPLIVNIRLREKNEIDNAIRAVFSKLF